MNRRGATLDGLCASDGPLSCLQASAKWRLLWRFAPRLLEHWSAIGRLDDVNAAVSTTTKKVRARGDWSQFDG